MEWTGVHELVQHARNGDRVAADRLYGMARPFLLALAQRLLGSNWPEKSVSDLIQETWLRAWPSLPDFAGGGNDENTGAILRAWLSKTMKNARLSDARFDGSLCRQMPGQAVSISPVDSQFNSIDPPARDTTPSEQLRSDEKHELVRAALQEMGESERDIVRLRFYDGMSIADIARRLQRDEATIRYHLQRVLDRLGRKLRDVT